VSSYGNYRGAIVVCAANSWDGVRLHDRQLAERLAEWAPVLYVDPPRSAISRYRRPDLAASLAEPALREIAPGLARLTPVVLPGLARPGVAPINARLMARAIRSAITQLGGDIHTVVESSVLLPVMGRCGEQQQVYWAQDDFVGSAELLGYSPHRLRRGDDHLTRSADVIIAANPVVAQQVRDRGRDVTLVPYGCDSDHFATTVTVAPAADVTVAKPAAFFMGHLGDRIDFPVLRAVIERGVPVLLVGPRHFRSDLAGVAELFDRPNVQWVGARDFERLPEYLAHAHVGLLPYNHSAFNVGSFPLKMLEYLASGVPVVATDLPAVRWLDSDHIDVHDDPAAFADAVEARLAQPRTAASDAARRVFAAGHTWEHRARAFAAVLGIPAAVAAQAAAVS
jgi:teichuronic acid biosynthesis glycosyltransferase TuaH